MKTQSKGLAVVTGASSGIGAVYADRLARRGYDLLLVARSRGPMEGLAKKLEVGTARKIDILAADLTDAKDLAGLERILRNAPDMIERQVPGDGHVNKGIVQRIGQDAMRHLQNAVLDESHGKE